MATTESETPLGEADARPEPEEAGDADVARANDPPFSAERSVHPDKRGKGTSRAPASGDAGAGPLEAYEAVARSARLPDLVALTQLVVGEAAAHRQADFHFEAKVAEAASEAKLPRAEADTPFGNVLKVLASGPEDRAERALASALWAHAVAESGRDDEDRTARDVLWLATHTGFDATPLLDRALGEDADAIWTAIADRVERVLAGRGASLGRSEAILGAAALAASTSPHAQALAAELGRTANDPLVRRLVASAADAAFDVPLEGDAENPPRGLVATTFLALTGLLFVIHGVGLVARVAFAYRKPARVTLSPEGVRVRTSVRILHRTIRERDDLIPLANVARVVREVRYPRAAFYAGLLALAIGSLLGVRTFVDGVRAASPSLLGAGLAIVALGIAADFVLGSLLPGSQGRCRVWFVPRSGRTLCVGNVDHARADALFTKLGASVR